MKQKFAALSLSAAALVGMAVHEGYRDRAYYATADERARGISTIGFGNTEGVRPGDTITVERALIRLLDTTNRFQAELSRCISEQVFVTQNQFDALMSWAYNVGTTQACRSTLVRKLNAGQEWCSELLRWDRQSGVVLPGLTKRRKEEFAKCVS